MSSEKELVRLELLRLLNERIARAEKEVVRLECLRLLKERMERMHSPSINETTRRTTCPWACTMYK
jgi:hypothetical protein